ncbi:MAG: tRNA pseudouridine(55) synthase TruB, partial [Methylophaga nitratireducenticrescens]
MSSNHVLQRVKRLYNANKAGHTGSLDPLATGVLPICLGEATKLSTYLLDADKQYQVRCQLGILTDSGDSDGAVIAQQDIPEFTAEQLQ